MLPLLYLTPWFPPAARVGAYRPAKFCLHLPALGWQPVVLADLRAQDLQGDGQGDSSLLAALPPSVQVHWEYASATQACWQRWQANTPVPPRSAAARAGQGRVAAWWHAHRPSPEWVPLGDHALDMPHAYRRGLALARQTGCRAVVTNADPHAALLVGDKIARTLGIPHVLDLRDPWSVCALRRPERPWPQRRLVDALERRCVANAAAVVLNTQTACQDYQRHYADLPATRFCAIRNHALAGTAFDAPDPPRDGATFRFLFSGTFRRHLDGGVLIDALIAARGLGLPARGWELAVTDALPPAVAARAAAAGILQQIVRLPRVPHAQIGALVDTADLLVSLHNRSTQRIPSKFYDFAVSRRPLLMIGDNREAADLAQQAGGATVVGLDDVNGIARALVEAVRAGPRRRIDRSMAGFDSQTASARLAQILDRVVRGIEPNDTEEAA